MPLQVINCVKIPSARIAAIRLIRSGWHLNIVGISDVTGFRMALILTGSLKCVKQPNCLITINFCLETISNGSVSHVR